MNSINLGAMDFAQFDELARYLGKTIEHQRETIGDSVYAMRYIRMANGSSFKCDNVSWWAIR